MNGSCDEQKMNENIILCSRMLMLLIMSVLYPFLFVVFMGHRNEYPVYSFIPQEKRAPTLRFLNKTIKYMIMLLCIAGISHQLSAISYGYTEKDVDDFVAASTGANCTASKKPFMNTGQLGYEVWLSCFHPERVKSTSGAWTGDVCMSGSGYFFSGGPYRGAGCNGSYVYWAYACDNTGNTISITPSTYVYRKCQSATLKTYCDGHVDKTDGGYIDLSTDCTHIVTSPCPYSITPPGDICNTKDLLKTFFPVCKDNDICYGSKDPCCGIPDCCSPGPPQDPPAGK